MSDFISLLQDRRSANKFLPDVDITDAAFEEMFRLVKYAPSAFNLQHAHYIVVKDPELKNKVYEASNKQYKVHSASAVIIVLGNTQAHQDVARINEGFLNLGILSKQEYDATVQSVSSFYEDRGDTFKRDEAIRNASLSAMTFLYIAKEKGWDTCPMIGFDAEAIQELLHIPSHYVPSLMIAIGKEDVSSQRPRGYRKPNGEFVSYNGF